MEKNVEIKLFISCSQARRQFPDYELRKMLDVSRQVIVQDVALLRAKDIRIHSTNRGYVIDKNQETLRVFKVIHTEEQTAEELQTIIDLGGWVKDVFVYHKTYGVIRGELNIHSRYDIDQYIADLKSGKSSQLMNVTFRISLSYRICQKWPRLS